MTLVVQGLLTGPIKLARYLLLAHRGTANDAYSTRIISWAYQASQMFIAGSEGRQMILAEQNY